jgi:heme/copper-type cytochrome/quinol oxidase subunit 2
MNKNDDLMLPSSSPGTLKQAGVRRVNNLPLIIVIIVLMLFVLMIAFVAMNRAEKQQSTEQEPVPAERRIDTWVFLPIVNTNSRLP